MPQQNIKEDVCAVCGTKVYRETDSKDIFCGKVGCLHTYANQRECSKCGIPAEQFKPVSSITSGRVTKEVLVCPQHSEYQITRYSFADTEPI